MWRICIYPRELIVKCVFDVKLINFLSLCSRSNSMEWCSWNDQHKHDMNCVCVCTFKLCNHVMKYTSLVLLLRSIMMPHMKYLISLICSSIHKWIGSERERIYRITAIFLPPLHYYTTQPMRIGICVWWCMPASTIYLALSPQQQQHQVNESEINSIHGENNFFIIPRWCHRSLPLL